MDCNINKNDIQELNKEVDKAIKLREEAFYWLQKLAENELPIKSNAYLMEELKEEQEQHARTRDQLEEKLCLANAEIESLKHQLKTQQKLNIQLASITNSKIASINNKNEKAGLLKNFEKLKKELESHDGAQHLVELCDSIQKQRSLINTLIRDEHAETQSSPRGTIHVPVVQQPPTLNGDLEANKHAADERLEIDTNFDEFLELKQLLKSSNEMITKHNAKSSENRDRPSYCNAMIKKKSNLMNTKKSQAVFSTCPVADATSNSIIQKNVSICHPQIKNVFNNSKKPNTTLPQLECSGVMDISKLIGLARSVQEFKTPKLNSKSLYASSDKSLEIISKPSKDLDTESDNAGSNITDKDL